LIHISFLTKDNQLKYTAVFRHSRRLFHT